MTEKPVLFLIGADKGGVGKTTIARALIDYLAYRKVPVRIFDTEHPKGDLRAFHPEADVIDFAAVKDQMKVFDGVATDAVTVVDIRAGVLSPMLQTLNDAHFLDDVRSGEIIMCVLHVLGPSLASLAEVAEVTKMIGGGARHLIVMNHTNDTQFDLAQDPRYTEVLRLMAPGTVNVSKLTEFACEIVQKYAVSFSAFIRGEGPPGGRLLRGKVRHWLESVWAEFDRVGIPNMLR
jgi:hypothetical protein